MTYLFSLIVPAYNHADCLPRLLDSVLAQGVDDMETVIVDDCSDHPCDEVVAAYRNKGMVIRLIRNPQRIYTKDARLAGVVAARGKYVGFADADDQLAGENVLNQHLDTMRKHDADVLHFRTMMVDRSGGFLSYLSWADPFAPALAKQAIFAAFCATEFIAAVIWNKIFSRHLFSDNIFYEVDIAMCFEDLFLNSITLFKAENYIGSDVVGYKYAYEEKKWKKSMGRAVAIYRMLEKVAPYLADNNCDAATLRLYVKKMGLELSNCVGRAGILAVDNVTGTVSDAECERLFREADVPTLVKTLLLGSAVNAEKLLTSFKAITGIS